MVARPQLSNLRWINDPELPEDDDEKLYFTMINLDMSNITEVQRLTKLEMQGCIDQAGLDEFVKADSGFMFKVSVAISNLGCLMVT